MATQSAELRSDPLGWGATAVAGVAFAGVAFAALSGRATLDVPWVPSLGLRLSFELDAFGTLYGLLAAGVAVAVFAYAASYLPRHLAQHGRPQSDGRTFWAWMVVFMVAMLGLASAQDLVLLFFFFDLTAVASYFLIGFDRERREARGAALMALLVTGVSAVLLLLGAVLLGVEYGTFSLPELIATAQPGGATSVASMLIVVAALAKSAQVPLHFWLPRAMAAPTPVSAYLHSAAMVAAGVLVIGRTHQLLSLDPAVLDVLFVVGLASIVVGGVLALAQDDLKQTLAYSTISQYGYVVLLYGLGGPAGAGAAALYVIAHALAKSALFLTAGAVTDATGESRLSRLGGLGRTMPLLAVASGISAASLAALPLTLGFFKDELFFGASLAAGVGPAAASVFAAALTFAYIARFWFGLFAGPVRTPPSRPARSLVLPVAAMAVVSLVGGIVVDPFARIATEAAAITHGSPDTIAPAYHLDARPENLMAVLAWALGAAILVASPVRVAAAGAVARVGTVIGPRRWYALGLQLLVRASDRVHRTEVRDLRTSLVAVLVPLGFLMGLAFAVTPTAEAYRVGEIGIGDLPVLVLLALGAAAALTVTRDEGRMRPVLALSVLGFALAAVYASVGAPDVALVAVVVETMLTFVFVGVYARLPPISDAPASSGRVIRRSRNVVAAVVAGIGAFAVIWAALSRPVAVGSDAARQIELTPAAHGGDVVTVILADFRGLDTLVEITVLAAAMFGAAALLRQRDAR